MPEAQTQTAAFKPKKSVALSGVTAGNTAHLHRRQNRQ